VKKLIKNRILYLLNILKRILTVFRNHSTPDPLIYAPGHYAYNRFIEEELKDSYEYFKKYFYTSIFLPEERLRNYAITKALKNDPTEKYLYLEFGVYTGNSTNFFSKKIKNTLYGFDSFEGFNEDWLGHAHGEGDFSLNKQIPVLEKNVSLEIGWVQDTLPIFLNKNKDKKINFIHMDMDTYKTSKFILEMVKPYLTNGAIICFDELYNYEGWKVGEFKALSETFKENEFTYKCFSNNGAQVVIEYNII
tara:strand:+ start:279 stop:1025 length:747 start_codon:yes stop_codon:yes gene_type:complete